jgi:hypothetical protein
MIFSLALFALPAPCPGPVVDVTSWPLRETQVFSYRLPLEFRKLSGGTPRITDYATTDGSSRVHVEFTGSADKLARGEGVTDYARCSDTIDGHEARVITARNPDGQYVAGATWAEVRPGRRLTLVVRTNDLAVLEQMLAAFRSVRIKAPS